MNEIIITLREDNLAEVLAGMGILGILNEEFPKEHILAFWRKNTLCVKSSVDESALCRSVVSWLVSLCWLDGLGGKESGCLVRSGLTGINPFLSGPNGALFKNFTGGKTAAGIFSGHFKNLKAVGIHGFASLLALIATDVRSWGFDSRTSVHTLDGGLSLYDDKQSGGIEYEPVFVAAEMLSFVALNFFIPPYAMIARKNCASFNLWRSPLSLQETPAAFLQMIPGLESAEYLAVKRRKIYRADPVDTYFPPAILTNQ